MLTMIAIMVLVIYGMPFFGLYLLFSEKQKSNRSLGVALVIVGIIIWFLTEVI